MSSTAIYILVAANLCLIFLLVAAPIGIRTFRLSRTISAPRQRLWEALWPLGEHASWSGEIVSAEAIPGHPHEAWIELSHEGRDARPIKRRMAFCDVVEGERFTSKVLEDTSLENAFWANYSSATSLDGDDGSVTVVFRRTDRYRGLAFMIFRYFAARRELAKLDIWARTGQYVKGGLFERPITQVGFAVLSAFLLWPLFGLSMKGFVFASTLTAAVALHELGHMAAFRLMGHKSARMIFIPLLGGIAIGGRPYDSRFEVAFSALMGAGFSAFLVPVAIFASITTADMGFLFTSKALAAFGACLAFFNLANLVPVWKFDGGQVLRQICPNSATLACASFVLLSAFLGLGHLVGFSPKVLIGAGAVFAILSVMTAGSAVKPRHELKPILTGERLVLAGGLVAVFALHASGVVWAANNLIVVPH